MELFLLRTIRIACGFFFLLLLCAVQGLLLLNKNEDVELKFLIKEQYSIKAFFLRVFELNDGFISNFGIGSFILHLKFKLW